MRLGILDFCSIRKGVHPTESLHETLELAREADALGYSRYWLAEHHELVVAHHAPELLVSLIAGTTGSLRVGVAGILLRLHSPMRVAKAFKLLEAFFPGRIDLGVGGGGAEDAVLEAMRGSAPPANIREDVAQRLHALVSLLGRDSPQPFNPLGVSPPPVWMLGSGSADSARLAAHEGTCFGLSLAHPKSRPDPSLTALYRAEFRPHSDTSRPECVLAVATLCAETEAEALALADRSPDHPRSGHEIVGSPAQCREKFESLCERYGTDELILLDLAPDSGSRRRHVQLLASALELAPPATE